MPKIQQPPPKFYGATSQKSLSGWAKGSLGRWRILSAATELHDEKVACPAHCRVCLRCQHADELWAVDAAAGKDFVEVTDLCRRGLHELGVGQQQPPCRLPAAKGRQSPEQRHARAQLVEAGPQECRGCQADDPPDLFTGEVVAVKMVGASLQQGTDRSTGRFPPEPLATLTTVQS